MIKKALVIGGTGFIGSHLVNFLKKKNFYVISFSKKKIKNKKKSKNVKYICGDISKFHHLKKKLKPHLGVDYVVNLGGEIDHSNFKKTYNSHFIGVKNLSNIFLKTKLKKFVQIGSSMEYGRARSPQIESKKAMPLSSYGKAKFMATKHILNLFFEYKFPGVVLRPYQVYGPNQDTKRLIPYVIKSCLHNKKFNCSGGKQYRDFLYVSDFIKAIYNSLKSNRTSGQVINVGFGKPYNIKKTIYFIKKKIKKGVPIFGKIKLRKEENLVTYPNISKSRFILKWKPTINLKNGLIKTINSYRRSIK